jgi:hypothetical protein
VQHRVHRHEVSQSPRAQDSAAKGGNLASLRQALRASQPTRHNELQVILHDEMNMECELNQYDEKLDMTRDFALDLAIWLPAGNGERQDEKHLQVGACTRLLLW